jgi:subtilisin family serine protease
MALNANATTKRYLVQFKSPETFKAMAQAMNQNSTMSFGSNNGVAHMFGSKTHIKEALEQVQLAVIETDDAQAALDLKHHPAVQMVEAEIMHPLPMPMLAKAVPQGNVQAMASKKMPMPWGISAVKAPQAWKTTKGEGARVMVLDTGLDKNHPAVSGRFENGENFTGGDMSDITDQVGHGTHVSGTILANGGRGGLVGVAPEAKLLMGKVCSSQGCSSIAIAQGLNWAAREHVDVVNMSLGGAMLSQGEVLALNAAENAGVMVVAASGNDGTARVGYPAAYRTALAVGAVDSSLTRASFSQYGPELGVVAPGVDVTSSVPQGMGRTTAVSVSTADKDMNEVKSLPMAGSPLGTVQNSMVDCGLGKPEDFAKVNVSGKIALIGRGDIAFADKVKNAIQAGAVGALIYNNAPGLIEGTLTSDGSTVAIPAAMIEQTVGQNLQSALAQGSSVTASLAVQGSDYAAFQGTSMATPHVAGVAALVRAANKNLTPAQVREILKSTATPLGPNNNNEYGSGLVNAEAAVARAVSMNPTLRQAAAN